MNNISNILLIEDDEIEADLIKTVMTDPSFGERIFVINTGEEALKLLHREPPYTDQPLPGLILLDLHIPRIDGHQILRDIRNNAATQYIPVVVFTGESGSKELEKVYAEDANCVIQKPTNSGDFIRTVRTIANFWLRTVTLPPGDQYR